MLVRSLAACLWRFIYIIWPILAAICSRGFVQQRQRAAPSNRDVFPAGSENILVTWPTSERESKRTEAERENHEVFLRDQSFALSSSSWRTPSSRAPSSIAALPCLPPATRRPHPRLISASKTIRRSLGPGRIRREQTAPPKSGHQEVRRAERREEGTEPGGQATAAGKSLLIRY